MQRAILRTTVLAIALVAMASLAVAEVPQLINYQGRLTDAAGDPVPDFDYPIAFTIYDAATGGNTLWTSGQQTVPVVNGLFHYQLGSVVPLPDTLFEDTLRWLGIKVGADPEVTPRVRLKSVPYAYHTLRADTADFAWSGPGGSGNWSVSDSVLYTNKYWGIARGGAGNVLYGDSSHTMVNLGVVCTTGTGGENYSYSTVSGGYFNSASGNRSTIGGGDYNTASTYCGTVGGGGGNTVSSEYGTISGGLWGISSGNHSTVGGGQSNTASGSRSTVSGGADNTASGMWGTVGGGGENTASDLFSTVGGGHGDTASGVCATIGGGNHNIASGSASAIGGGADNTASGDGSTVSGGADNSNAGEYSVIPGGYADTITESANYSYLFGIGSKLTQDSTFMVDMPHIWFGSEADGYEFPTSDGSSSQVMVTDGNGQLSWVDVSGTGSSWSVTDSVLYTNKYWGIARGGANNALYGDSVQTMVNLGVACTTGTSGQSCPYSTVSGGRRNTASDTFTTVGGGQGNVASVSWSTVGGGLANTASGRSSTVAGGYTNTAEGGWSIVSGGLENTASGERSTVSGGYNNSASGDLSTISGGEDNTASGLRSTVGGGWVNTASGSFSTVPGGRNNVASGHNSFAAGRHAKANHHGAFVWADHTDEDFASTGDDQFLIRASGGVGIGTTSPQGALDVSSTTGALIVPRMTTAQRDALTAVNGMIIYNTTDNQFNFYENDAWVTK